MATKKLLPSHEYIKHIIERTEHYSFNSKGFGSPNIKVIGIGDSGCNTINRINRIGIKNIDTIAINSNEYDLGLINSDKKLVIGPDYFKGLSSRHSLEDFRNFAKNSVDKIDKLIKGADLVFITLGLGGNTGTGISPVVAEIAKKNNSSVICIVTLPFKVETGRLERASKGIDELKCWANNTVIIDNGRILEFVPDLPINQAFSVMDQLIAETIKGLAETIIIPSLINLDCQEIEMVSDSGGVSILLWGEADYNDGVESIIMETLNHPLLNVDYSRAKGCIIHISGGPEMSLKYVQDVAKGICQDLKPYTSILLGAQVSPEFKEKCRVLAILTGIPYLESIFHDIFQIDTAPSGKSIKRVSNEKWR